MLAECQLATDIVRCTILMLLYEKPSHGYAIMQSLAERLDRAISPAIIYPFLTQMIAAGYLTSSHESTGRRARTIYSMTPSGRKFSEGVFKQLSRIVSTALEPNLLHCANCGCKLYEAGHVEKINGKLVSFCCVHCARAYRRERL